MKINKEIFFCISNHNNKINNLLYLTKLSNDYIIYDKTHSGGDLILDGKLIKVKKSNLDKKFPSKKIIKSNINGYNIYDYLCFIIDNYDHLPNRIAFLKGNVIERHITKKKFNENVVKEGFIELFFEEKKDKIKTEINSSSFRSFDNFLYEKNSSWFLHNKNLKTKYFNSTKKFMDFCFDIKTFSLYLKFSPGACFICNKEHIISYPKIFYENLRIFVSHSRLPGEAHLLERLFPTILMNKFKISSNMKKKLSVKNLLLLEKEKQDSKGLIKWLKKNIYKALSHFSGKIFYFSTKKLYDS